MSEDKKATPIGLGFLIGKTQIGPAEVKFIEEHQAPREKHSTSDAGGLVGCGGSGQCLMGCRNLSLPEH